MSALRELSHDIEVLVQRTRPSVVAVEHARGHGSGIVISQDGYVLTNAHVVGAETSLLVRFPHGDELDAALVGRDPASDLAVIRVAANGLPSLVLQESRRVRVGQIVLALGNPLRLEGSASLGIVSALDRTLPGTPRDLPGTPRDLPQGPRDRRGMARDQPLEGLIQTDAAINPGSSGGPLLDAEGYVIGINTAMIALASALGFAIPAYTASWVTAMLIKHGSIRRPWIGVAATGVELERRSAGEAAPLRAVCVHQVMTDSPAERAGLRRGDHLLEANGQPLASVNDLQRVLVLSEGAPVDLTLSRNGNRETVSLLPRAPQRAA